MGRRSGCAHNQAKPSLISALKLIFSRGLSLSIGLKLPERDAIKATAIKKEMASMSVRCYLAKPQQGRIEMQ